MLDNIWNTKVKVELTLKELEEITLSLWIANKAFTGNTRSDLEEKLSNIVQITKMSI